MQLIRMQGHLQGRILIISQLHNVTIPNKPAVTLSQLQWRNWEMENHAAHLHVVKNNQKLSWHLIFRSLELPGYNLNAVKCRLQLSTVLQSTIRAWSLGHISEA